MSHRRAARTSVTAGATVGAFMLGSVSGALAHPHVWVTTETTVLFENSTITGLRQKWSFDDFYTSMALQGLDTNNDGAYDRSELDELAKVNMDGLKEFDYFTTVRLVSEKLKLGAPKDYWLEHTDAPEGATRVTMKTGDAAFEGTGVAPETKSDTPPETPGFFARWWAWLFGNAAETNKTAATPPAKPKVLSLHFTLPLAQPVLAEAQGFSFTIADPSFFIAFEPAANNAVVLGPGAPTGCRVASAESSDQTEASATASSPSPAAPTNDVTPAPVATPAAESNTDGGSEPLPGPNPAADASRLGDALTQQFGGQSVAFSFARPATISCRSPS